MKTPTLLTMSLVMLALVTSASVAQPKPQGSKLFPEVFDDDWTPPVRAEPKPGSPGGPASRPATRPSAPTPTTPAVGPTPVPPSPVPAPPAADPAPPEVALLDIPSADELAKSRKLMREVFAQPLADKTPAGRQKLVDLLLAEAEKVRDNVVDRYVLLSAVLQAAREAGDMTALVDAADVLGGEYQVDPLAVKTDIAVRLNFKAATPERTAENVAGGLAVVDELLQAEDFVSANKVVQAMQTAAATDAGHRDALLQRIREINHRSAALDRVIRANERLRTVPGDPASLSIVGSYLCFYKDDWAAGLPMLAKGADAALKAIAEAELAGATTAEKRKELGDLWWGQIAKEPNGSPSYEQCRARAAHWYRLAEPDLDGLSKTLVTQRLESLPADTGGSASGATRNVGGGKVSRFTVPAGDRWIEVDFELVEGKCYELLARGRWTNASGDASGPDGICPPAWQSVLGHPAKLTKQQREAWYLDKKPRSALIARVEPGKTEFFVGNGQTFLAPASMKLMLRMNDGDSASPSRKGQIDVTIREVTPKWVDDRGQTSIAARIDASDTLHLTPEGIYWKWGGKWSRVGHHDGYYPTAINGILWWPTWPNKQQSDPLKSIPVGRGMKVTLVRFEAARGKVTLESNSDGQPAIKFDDQGLGSIPMGCVITVK